MSSVLQNEKVNNEAPASVNRKLTTGKAVRKYPLEEMFLLLLKFRLLSVVSKPNFVTFLLTKAFFRIKILQCGLQISY